MSMLEDSKNWKLVRGSGKFSRGITGAKQAYRWVGPTVTINGRTLQQGETELPLPLKKASTAVDWDRIRKSGFWQGDKSKSANDTSSVLRSKMESIKGRLGDESSSSMSKAEGKEEEFSTFRGPRIHDADLPPRGHVLPKEGESYIGDFTGEYKAEARKMNLPRSTTSGDLREIMGDAPTASMSMTGNPAAASGANHYSLESAPSSSSSSATDSVMRGGVGGEGSTGPRSYSGGDYNYGSINGDSSISVREFPRDKHDSAISNYSSGSSIGGAGGITGATRPGAPAGTRANDGAGNSKDVSREHKEHPRGFDNQRKYGHQASSEFGKQMMGYRDAFNAQSNNARNVGYGAAAGLAGAAAIGAAVYGYRKYKKSQKKAKELDAAGKPTDATPSAPIGPSEPSAAPTPSNPSSGSTSHYGAGGASAGGALGAGASAGAPPPGGSAQVPGAADQAQAQAPPGGGAAGVPGKAPLPPYPIPTKESSGKATEGDGKSDGNPEAQMAEKAQGPDTNRTDPITPATGSMQTPATANSIVGVPKLRKMKNKMLSQFGTEEVFGDARERANVGQGALSTHQFSGTFDHPTWPGGHADETLTAMGAWRTKKGHQSSLWFSNKNSRGGAAKRARYLKYSTKGGGNWRKLNKGQMSGVFSKPDRLQGGNFMLSPAAGTKFADLQASSLKRKMEDIQAGKEGNVVTLKRRKANSGEAKKIGNRGAGCCDAPPSGDVQM